MLIKSEDYEVTDSVFVYRTFHIILCTTEDMKASKGRQGEMAGLKDLLVSALKDVVSSLCG